MRTTYSLDQLVSETFAPIKEQLGDIIRDGILLELYDIIIGEIFANFKKVDIDPENFDFTVGQKEKLFDAVLEKFNKISSDKKECECSEEVSPTESELPLETQE